MAPMNNTINYIEFPLLDKEKTIAFYSSVFGWEFQDWGPGYIGFSKAGIAGGFNGECKPCAEGAGPLVVLFSDDLEETVEAVRTAGGRIVKDIFEFPGGRRFHFADPNRNEIAVWGNLVDE